jgi:hypothetical protein
MNNILMLEYLLSQPIFVFSIVKDYVNASRYPGSYLGVEMITNDCKHFQPVSSAPNHSIFSHTWS